MPIIETKGYGQYYQDDCFADHWLTPDTIFIQHGFGRNANFWNRWVPLLADDFRVIRRDFRGMGQSAPPGPEYHCTLELLIGDIIDFLDALKLDKIHYVGESMGGVIGIAFAAAHPERLHSLTLLSTPTSLPAASFTMSGGGFRDPIAAIKEIGVERWIDRLLAVPGTMADGKGNAEDAWIRKEWARLKPEGFIPFMELMMKIDVSADCPRITVPTHLIPPTNSWIIPLEVSLQIHRSIPNSKLTVIAASSHETYRERPAECVQAVRRFFSELPAHDS